MIHHSYNFPPKDLTFDFIPPYTITCALHISYSHYVGYRLLDSTGNNVDVFEIFELKNYIEANPSKFTNVSISPISGQLDIDDFENLPHEESKEFKYLHERKGVSEALYKLLNISDKIIVPRQIYCIDKSKKGELKCSFSKEFKLYIKNFHKQIEFKVLVIPAPLQIFDGKKVTDCSNLFSGIDFTRIEFDLSLVDLRYFQKTDNLFSKAKIDDLHLCKFNLNPILANNMFKSLKCNLLSFDNCNFSQIDSFESAFSKAKIDTLTADNFHTKSSACYVDCFINTVINKFDARLFADVCKESLVALEGSRKFLFNNLTCDTIEHLDELPLQDAVKLDSFFSGLTIDVLNLKGLNLPKLTNFTRFLYKLNCKKIDLFYNFFEKAEIVDELLAYSSFSGYLDLSNFIFPNIVADGCKGMFKNISVVGVIMLPKVFGNATNLDYTFSNCDATGLIFENTDFSKVESMNGFLSGCTVYKDIKFPKDASLIPNNLKLSKNIFQFTKAPSLDLCGWNQFDLEHLGTFNKSTACTIEISGNKVLDFNVSTIKVDDKKQNYQKISNFKVMNYYYDQVSNGDCVTFTRDITLIDPSQNEYK